MHDEEEIEAFCKKYGTFFEEFQETSLSFWLFYVFYIFRRLSIVFFSNAFSDGTIQLTLYLTFSLAVISSLGIFIYNYYKGI